MDHENIKQVMENMFQNGCEENPDAENAEYSCSTEDCFMCGRPFLLYSIKGSFAPKICVWCGCTMDFECFESF